DGPVVVDPRGRFAPGGQVVLAVAVHDASPLLRIDPHARSHADAERTLLGIAKHDRPIAGLDGNGHVDPATIRIGPEGKRPLVLTHQLAAVWAEPVVARDDHGL